MIRILVADDHAVVREGLKQIIAAGFPGAAIDQADNGVQVLHLVRKHDWDIIILDITMPGLNGLEVLAELKRARASIPVLVLSAHPEEQYAVRALKLGAAGYVTKETAPEELVAAIQKILGNGKYISSSLAERIAVTLSHDSDKPPHETLSNREYQILCMIASGKSLSDAAKELALSVKTVSTYRTRILEKMRMKHNAELTHYAIRHGLVD